MQQSKKDYAVNGEFDLITHYFKTTSRSKRRDVVVSIGDDCALTTLEAGMSIATTTDTLVEDTHFLSTISPEDLAYKAVAVNLSDLAAMGAQPAWISLALTLPYIDNRWLKAFSESLFTILEQYNVELIGGDTTSGKLSLTLTAQGIVDPKLALRRSGAQIGDDIYVTGNLGDSRAGLELLILKDKTVGDTLFSADQSYLITRHLRPTPRVEVGLELLGLANSALDISDGLMADLKHILSSSKVDAQLNLESIPLSNPLKNIFPLEKAYQFALTGGEDYELCFTAPAKNASLLKDKFKKSGIPLAKIGVITAQNEQESTITVTTANNKPFVVSHEYGFDHFK